MSCQDDVDVCYSKSDRETGAEIATDTSTVSEPVGHSAEKVWFQGVGLFYDLVLCHVN